MGIECDLAGNPNMLQCPAGLLWEQGLLSCVYPLNAGGNVPANPVNQVNNQIANPCTAKAISSSPTPTPPSSSSVTCTARCLSSTVQQDFCGTPIRRRATALTTSESRPAAAGVFI